MTIERAALQLVGPDGTWRACQRPDEIRRLVDRVAEFPVHHERCQLCRDHDAVSVRSGLSVCHGCRTRIRPIAEVDEVRYQATPAPDVTAGTLSGLAIVFDRLSQDLGGFKERILPSAADRLMTSAPDIRALWNHDTSAVLGRTVAGTLTMQKTIRGVETQIEPPASAAGYVESITRGDISGMSFGFIVLEDDFHLEGDLVVRDVIDMRVLEVSPVAFPAYLDTMIRVTPAAPAGRSLRYFDRRLRALGIH